MSEEELRIDGYASILKVMIDIEVARYKLYKKCIDAGMSIDQSSKLVLDVYGCAERASKKLEIHNI